MLGTSQIFIVVNGQRLKCNQAIWSHYTFWHYRHTKYFEFYTLMWQTEYFHAIKCTGDRVIGLVTLSLSLFSSLRHTFSLFHTTSISLFLTLLSSFVYEEERTQCDKMARLLFSNLGIYNIQKLPKSIKVAKVGSQFCQILNKPSKIAKDFKNIAKVANFRQIWSH